MHNAAFSNETLRALGLNEAGIRKAWFRVSVQRRTARGRIVFTHCRCSTADEANEVVQMHLAGGRWPKVDVWWTGNHEPVRMWAPMPPRGYKIVA